MIRTYNNSSNWYDNWITDYKNIVNVDPQFFRELLSKNPRLICDVDSECFSFLMENFESEIRYGLANNWEILFAFSQSTFIKHHQIFENELKPHFIKRPGLWFYIFRYDVSKRNARQQQVDTALINMRNIMTNWKIDDLTLA